MPPRRAEDSQLGLSLGDSAPGGLQAGVDLNDDPAQRRRYRGGPSLASAATNLHSQALPDVDFYFIFQALGFLVELLRVLFAIGRMAGWLAQWREGRPDAEQKIACPRPIHVGEGLIHLRPEDKRDRSLRRCSLVRASPAVTSAGVL